MAAPRNSSLAFRVMATTSEPLQPGLWNIIWMWAYTAHTPVKCCLQSIITNMDTTRQFEVISEKKKKERKKDISFTESVPYFNQLLKRTELHTNNKNACMGRRSTALFVLNLNIRCRWEHNFTPRPLYRRVKTLRMGYAACVGDLGTRKISCLCPYLNPESFNQ